MKDFICAVIGAMGGAVAAAPCGPRNDRTMVEAETVRFVIPRSEATWESVPREDPQHPATRQNRPVGGAERRTI